LVWRGPRVEYFKRFHADGGSRVKRKTQQRKYYAGIRYVGIAAAGRG